MAAYPTTLPRPSSDGYQIQPVDQVVRTSMEGGNTRSRRRTTARVDKIPVTFFYTEAQMANFRDWFEDSAGADGGAGWFDMTLETGDNAAALVEAKFASVWQASYVPGGYWNITATLEVRYA